MSVTLRCWSAALALGASAMILCAGADPRSLGLQAALAMVALFGHLWVIAVAERAATDRGGVSIKRFPLGPRLVQGRSDLLPQFLVPVVLLGLASHSMQVALIGLVVVLGLSIQVFRKMLPFLLPIVALVYGLLTMDEFHTMGDLVVTARGWVLGGLALIGWAFVLAGPLLRTDVGGRLLPKARLVAMLASLPGYLAAFFVFSRTPLAGTQHDLLALAFALLAGGTVQSLLLSLLARSAEMEDRDHEDYPWVDAADVGIALMPLTMPLVAVVAFTWMRLPAAWASLAVPSAWAGLLVLALIVPAIPAAGLVGAALDRLDGTRRSRGAVVFAGAGFALWFVLGPQAIEWLYADGGLMAGLRSSFPSGGTWVVRSGTGGHAALGGLALGGDVTLYGLPMADLIRGGTLMMLGVSALTARYLRHAEEGLIGVGFGTMTIAWVLQLLLCVVLMSKLGPTGAALGTAAACLVMLAVDVLTGERSVLDDQLEPHEEAEAPDLWHGVEAS